MLDYKDIITKHYRLGMTGVCVISPLVHKNEGSRINCPHE